MAFNCNNIYKRWRFHFQLVEYIISISYNSFKKLPVHKKNKIYTLRDCDSIAIDNQN